MPTKDQYIKDLFSIAADGHASYGLAREMRPTEFADLGVEYGYMIEDPDAEEGSGAYLPVTLATIRDGLAKIEAAEPTGDNATTIKFLSQTARATIVEGLQTRGDTGAGWDDAGLCTTVAEIGLFDQVVYG